MGLFALLRRFALLALMRSVRRNRAAQLSIQRNCEDTDATDAQLLLQRSDRSGWRGVKACREKDDRLLAGKFFNASESLSEARGKIERRKAEVEVQIGNGGGCELLIRGERERERECLGVSGDRD